LIIFPIDFLPGKGRSNGTGLTHYRRSEAELVSDRVHPAEFFIEATAGHGGVFLADEVGEDAGAHVTVSPR
jgi:hypothetical protein